FLSIICSSIGIIVAVIARDYKMANALSMLFYLPPAWVSGMYLPISVITKSSALKIIAMCLPFSYPVATRTIDSASDMSINTQIGESNNSNNPWFRP
ncbi:ABC transporter permease, partial [Mycoplasmopsis bovis]|uniref:ABC transporter permease n=1 Tax=Mycoplasmopsis bovis TaxID=28903 RepID=UPI003D2E56B7